MNSPRGLIKLALFTLCLFASRSFSAESAPESTADKIPPESFDAKVLRVYAAKDGKAIFRAYVVKWRDQEVIADDPLAKSDYKEGDTITVLAINLPFPQGQEPHRLLHFTVTPKRHE